MSAMFENFVGFACLGMIEAVLEPYARELGVSKQVYYVFVSFSFFYKLIEYFSGF